MNVDLTQTANNVHYKKCETTYNEKLKEMLDNGQVSLRGLQANAKLFDELIFDINSDYFQKHGGYEFAKEFYERAFHFAEQEMGANNVISAVMHADEINTALTEEYGKPIYHYHLHVVALPVVRKEVKWTKKCKDKSLIGTTKEVINQVSHSNKWKSEQVSDNQGKPVYDKKGNMVIVKDTSRLGRDYISFGEYIEKYFPEHQVRFVSIIDNYDSEIDNEIADTLPFRAVLNDLYARDTSKKVKATKHRNAINGLFNGKFAPYGYMKSPENCHKLIINEEYAKNVRRIYDLYLERKSSIQIAYIFNEEHIPTPSQTMGQEYRLSPLWKTDTIRRILKNEMYIGNMIQGKQTQINYKLKKPIHNKKEDWIIVSNTHEPIIDKEKFYAVQELLKSRTRTRTKTLNLKLKGLLYCKECGKKLGAGTSHYKNGKWNQIYLHCRTYQSLPNLKLCTPHCMNYTKLENAVIEEVQNICRKYLDIKKCKQIIDNNNNNVQNEIELNKEKNNLAKAIEVLDFQIEKLYEDKLKCLINDNDFSRMYEKKVNERDSKNKKLEELNTIKFERNVVDYEKIIQDFLKKELDNGYFVLKSFT